MLVAPASVAPADTAAVVSIVMEGTFFSEPAHVRFVVAVEPNEENRLRLGKSGAVEVVRQRPRAGIHIVADLRGPLVPDSRERPVKAANDVERLPERMLTIDRPSAGFS